MPNLVSDPEQRFGVLLVEILQAIRQRDQVACCECARTLLANVGFLSLRETAEETPVWPRDLIQTAQSLAKAAAMVCERGSRYQINILDRVREFDALAEVATELEEDKSGEFTEERGFNVLLHLAYREFDREVREVGVCVCLLDGLEHAVDTSVVIVLQTLDLEEPNRAFGDGIEWSGIAHQPTPTADHRRTRTRR